MQPCAISLDEIKTGGGQNVSRLPPLCIDLDGTLLRTDTLWETALAHVKTRPWRALLFPLWLLRGRAYLKHRVAEGIKLDCDSLPYTPDLLDYLRQAHASGRELVLVSACDHSVGVQIAEQLGFFNEVITSDGKTNLKGQTKAQLLNQRFGRRGFDYVGNETADFPVWENARECLVANAPRQLTESLERQTGSLREFAPRTSRIPALLKALRCHQWAKNVLVFLPLITAHAYFDGPALARTFVVFIAWCLVASGIYVSNDLLDLEADRQHPSKCRRPFACGDLPLSMGILLAPLLLVLGMATAATISAPCLAALVLYAVSACAYSFYFKKRPLVDVFLLAFLFTIRVVGGGLASGYTVTIWLLAFASFLFLGLAFLKRCSELIRIQQMGRVHLGSRGYGVVDLPILEMFGVASAFIAIMVLGLYLNSAVAETHYRWPAALWAVGPCVLLWLCRLWLATARGEMNDDPLVYSTKDWFSWLIGACVLAVFVIASTGKFGPFAGV